MRSPSGDWKRRDVTELKIGDRVQLLGVGMTRSVVMQVERIERDELTGALVFHGSQPFGEGWRAVTRSVRPTARAWRWQSTP